MPLTIASNIPSIKVQGRLSQTSKEMSSVYERLSSGQRINRASDDAAGLAVSTALDTNVRVYGQAVRNGNDGVSLLAVADAALSELTGVVTRISELATQAANGPLSNSQRLALDAEAQALSQEF